MVQRSKGWPSRILVIEVCTKVFVPQEQRYEDLNQSPPAAGTKILKFKYSPSGILVLEIETNIFSQQD